MDFSERARWIWNAGEPQPHNLWLRFRRVFQPSAPLRKATLSITADSRYELYLNGHEVGRGPVRSFPWSYSYDEYDVTADVRAGQDTILGVRVVHWGDHTFQYILGRGGLLCELVMELENGQVERLVTDEQWSVSVDAAFTRYTPRISVQQAFEEHYDARLADDWLLHNYDSKDWDAATVLGAVGMEPWTTLEPRTIPFLCNDDVQPTRVLAAEIAQTLSGYHWSLDIRRRVKDLQRVALRAEALGTRGMAFVTEIIASQACDVTLAHIGTVDYLGYKITCNGQLVQREFHLQPGRNLFVCAYTEWPALYFHTDADLVFDASALSGQEGAAWVYLGPFDERDDTYERILSATERSPLPAVPRTPISADENMQDIYMLTSTQRFVLPPEGFCDPSITRAQPRLLLERHPTQFVEQPAHLLHQNNDYTLLHPQAEGDIHLIIDFGREVVGFPVLELDATAGTIVDANFFEGIDESGIFWTDGLRNSFRYVCREGRQVFQSHQRRGYRYAALTFRFPHTAPRPVRLYHVHTILNTYPVAQRGAFACSDALLTKIWEVAAYTVQLCMEDTYVDCPAYEQVFWVGDARNSALVNAIAFGAYRLTGRSLKLTGQSLSRHVDQVKAPHTRKRVHLTTDHVASGWFSEIPMWTFLWIWNVWEHYVITGDLVQLNSLYPDVRECLHRCLGFLSPRGLLNIPDVWNLVDWSAMDLTRDGEVTSSNALLVESLRRAAQMAETLATESEEPQALHDEAQHYRASAEQIYRAINAFCWSEERGAYVDTVRDQQAYAYHQALAATYGTEVETWATFSKRTRISENTNTLVLLCNCAPIERAARILPLAEAAQNGKFVGTSPGSAHKKNPAEIVPVGSPWFLFFTAETLLANGKIDLVIQLIREQWGRMLEKGATTFWETFPNPAGTHWSRSLCHGWSAAPAYFLSTQVLGVRPASPGFERVHIAPRTVGLTWARGSVPTPHGDIHVAWNKVGAAWEIAVDVPAQLQWALELHAADSTVMPEHVAGVRGQLEQRPDSWIVQFQRGGSTRYRCGV